MTQVRSRKIGRLTMIDIEGNLTGSGAMRAEEMIERSISDSLSHNKPVVLNIKAVTDMDTLGMRMLLRQLSRNAEAGILVTRRDFLNLIDQTGKESLFRTFYHEEEAVSAYGPDLVSNFSSDTDQRRSGRLGTALPLEFYSEDEGEKVCFQAVVTNLSEGGLFAEYIDVKSAEDSFERLSPYDLGSLRLKLTISGKRAIRAHGKLVHVKMDGEQVGFGIQFDHIGDKEKLEIRDFLDRNLLNSKHEVTVERKGV